MVALKGKSDIGDAINKKIIAPLANANKLSDMPDFNDANKLGSGKEMVDRLTNLIAIFENRALDFSKNRLNTEIAKKPNDCLEYAPVHEMLHLVEPTHNAHFIALIDRFMPRWQLLRQRLNRLPVRHEDWVY